MTEESSTVKCPYCAEEIKKGAVFCRFCGYNLSTGQPPTRVEPTPQPAQQAVNQPAVREVKAQSGVVDGVKLGCGMFIILPILIGAGILFVLFLIGAVLSGGG